MNLCYQCFNEYEGGELCPYCGYDNGRDRVKYPLALPHGSVLAGRYVVGKVLGQGGFGITYIAQDYHDRRFYALKEFFPEQLATRSGTTVQTFSGDREEGFRYGKECFLAEARTLAEFIGNPNIVRVYSYFEENNTAYFAMELIRGVTLIDHLHAKGERITFDEALTYLVPIMDALTAIHAKGIIHRDISPDNIYITDDGTVKLIDFGAARYSLGDRSRSLDVVLKHGYAPKEQYARHGRQGPYTDVYSLAATMYRCLTGEIPPDSIERMEEDTMRLPTATGCSLPKKAEQAILKAMAVNAPDRYQSVDQFKRALLAAEFSAARRSAATKPASAPKPADQPQPKSKKPLLIAVIAAALVLIAGTVVGVILAVGGDDTKSLPVTPTPAPVEDGTTVETPGPITNTENSSPASTAPAGDPDYDYEIAADGTVTINSYKGSRSYVTVPSTIEGRAVTTLGYHAFYENTSLKSVTIPEGVTTIGRSAFNSCTSLSDVKLPSTLKMIDGVAFAKCTALTGIDIPDGVTEIGEAAFNDCSSLSSVRLPSGLGALPQQAFENCDRLSRITVPAAVQSIGKRAFNGCSALTEVRMSDGLTAIGEKAFWECRSLRSITIPDSVSTIGPWAFYHCTALSDLTLPAALTSLEEGVLQGCTSLSSVAIPARVTNVAKAAFNECTALSSVTLPDGVTAIGDFAFQKCASLRTVTFSKELLTVGESAFSDCTTLASVTLPDKTRSLGHMSFAYCTKLTKASVPKSCKVDATAFTKSPCKDSVTYR